MTELLTALVHIWTFEWFDSQEGEYTECSYYLLSDRREDAIIEFNKDENVLEFTLTLEDTIPMDKFTERTCLPLDIIIDKDG